MSKCLYYLACFFLIALMIFTFIQVADAKSYVLNKGSKWTLNLDGRQETLVLYGGDKRFKASDGGWKRKFNVTWGKRNGSLLAVSDAKNTHERINLTLIPKNGSKVKCQGYVARKTGAFMAGTCGGNTAWYATPLGSAKSGKTNSNTTKQQKYDKKGLQSKNRTTSIQSYGSFKENLEVEIDSGTKANAPFRQFPGKSTKRRKIIQWLESNKGDLSETLHLVFNQSEMLEFEGRARNSCSDDNIFCHISIRQQAIFYLLGGE